MANNNELEKKDIYLGQTTIEQVQHIDDNFTQLFNKDDTNDERFEAIESNVSGVDSRLKTVEDNYITKAVSDLANYYTKTQTDSKITDLQTTLQNQISQIPKFSISVVTSLPTSNISTTTIYLLKTADSESGTTSGTNNLYTEYIYVDEKWEQIGTQKLDLSGYAQLAKSNTFTKVNAFLCGLYVSEDGISFTDTDGDISDLRKLSRSGNSLYLGDERILIETDLEDYSQDKHSQELLQGTNLNTLYGEDKVGWYYGATTTGMSNYPISSTTGFGLEVGVNGNNYYYQRFITSNGVTYVRITYNGSNWGNWVRVAMYDDLVQVNNGKLTIQKNGTTVQTFTANQSGDVTANIEVPIASTTAPKMDGTATVGTATTFARADHIHPTDTSRASTAVATTSSNGLMSSTDKSRLDTLYNNTGNQLVKVIKTFTADQGVSLTLSDSTYYGYTVGDDRTSFDIVSVYNSSGFGVVYQEYRTSSATYVVVTEKMALAVHIIVKSSEI